MQWCPLTKSDCKKECAWFSQEECAFARLHEVADKVADAVEVISCLESLEQTIKNKEF